MNLNWEFLIELAVASGAIMGILGWVKNSIGKDVSGLKIGIDGLKEDIKGIKEDIKGVKSDLKTLTDKVDKIDVRLARLEGKYQGNIDAGISPIKRRQRNPTPSEV